MASVSVIIPVYNRAKRVRRAIQSVLCQTYSDLEVVVVDHGSNDDTMQIVQEEAHRDSRVRPIRRDQRKGAQAARNTGIRAARGEWIAFLDSDDYWLPDSLEVRLGLMGNSRTTIVHSEYYLLNPDKIELELVRSPDFRGNGYKQLLHKPEPMFQSLLAAREAFARIDYLDESIVSYQEWDTVIRLAKHYSFVLVPGPHLCTTAETPIRFPK
jgi:glycosyltransferase involved in cell wall biosynthesis